MIRSLFVSLATAAWMFTTPCMFPAPAEGAQPPVAAQVAPASPSTDENRDPDASPQSNRTPGSDETPDVADTESPFLQVVRDKNSVPQSLRTAVTHCVPMDCGRNGPTVDLISAVHVADKAYYERLNQLFDQYDVVLYELVAPEGQTVPKPDANRSRHPLSFLQHGMADTLELEFQLSEVDYTKQHFVHADMSPEQFAQSMRDRNESFLAIFFRMMGYSMAQQGPSSASSDAQLLVALMSRNRALALKRLMAGQFEDMEGSIAAIDGPDGSTLIQQRNKFALKVLREQIDAGHQKLAIFYGAAHMPDFQKRLREDFQLTSVRTRWLVAWDMSDGKQKDEGKDKGRRRERRGKKQADAQPAM